MTGNGVGSAVTASGLTYHFTRPPVGVPFQAPPLPEPFVLRPDVLQPLKERLLAQPGEAASPLAICAQHGLGGIGRSTLAAALAYDAEVQGRFKDGILWATLGRQPDVLSLLSGWIHALRDYQFHPLTVESASAHLRTLLEEKDCLLVIDDAWQAEHIRPFMAGGQNCRALITTLQAQVAGAAGAEAVELPAMPPEQALALLEAHLPNQLAQAGRQETLELAQQLGCLPLALKLAAAHLSDGMSLPELGQALEAYKSRLLAQAAPPLEAEARDKHLALQAVLALSIRPLTAERRTAFAWLGILPEDAVLNPKMAATLWGLPDETQAGELLRHLYERGMLLRGDPGPDGSASYRVHDLLHDAALKLLMAPIIPLQRGDLPGLGLLPPQANALLLGRYRARCSAAPAAAAWHTLPNDGYIHARLGWHIQQAGWMAEVHALLREESAAGRNAWFEARQRLGQTEGYLDDIRRAWNMTCQAGGGLDVGLQVRYALMLASLNSLAASIPPELLDALVKHQLWPPEQGLAYARQKPDPAQQSLALSTLVKYLPIAQQGGVLAEALAAALRAANLPRQTQALAALVPYLTQPLLGQVLATVQHLLATEPVDLVAPILAALAVRLAQLGQPGEALEMAGRIDSMHEYALTLGAMAPYLPPAALIKALERARAITVEGDRAMALLGLAPYLTGEADDQPGESLPAQVVAEVIEFASRLAGQQTQWFSIYDPSPVLGPLIRPLARAGYVADALSLARQVQGSYYRVQALAALLPYLPPEQRQPALDEALAGAQEAWNDSVPPDLLAGLAPYLPEEQRLAVVNKVLTKPPDFGDDARWPGYNEDLVVQILTALAPYLSPSLLTDAYNAVLKLRSRKLRVDALTALAASLPPQQQRQALNEALAAVQQIADASMRAEMLVTLVPHVRLEALPQALAVSQPNKWSRYRAVDLAARAGRLAEAGLSEEALGVARRVEAEPVRAGLLAELAGRLPPLQREPLLAEALAAARQVEWADKRSQALAAVAAGQAGAARSATLGEALEAARQAGWDLVRVQALLRLVPVLSPWQRLRALADAWITARRMQPAALRPRAMAAILPHLPARLTNWLLPRMLKQAQQVPNDLVRTRTLADLVPYLPEDLRQAALQEMLAAARSAEPDDNRVQALEALLDAIRSLDAEGLGADGSADLLKDALAIVRMVEQEGFRAMALQRLAPQLFGRRRELMLREAVGIAQVIEDRLYRIQALAALAPGLVGEEQETLLAGALETARQVNDERRRAEGLALLAPLLEDEPRRPVLAEALGSAARVLEPWDRAQALAALAPALAQMPGEALAQLWQATLPVLAGRPREDLLSDLAALEGVLYALGGELAATEALAAVQDVGRWFP